MKSAARGSVLNSPPTGAARDVGEHVMPLSRAQPWFPEVYSAVCEARKNCRKPRFHLAVAGESGSGKTTLAYSLSDALLEEQGVRSLVLKIDNYFFLPPRTNHAERQKDLKRVGPGEVNLGLLDENLALSWSGVASFLSPVKSYLTDASDEQEVLLDEIDCVIIEGTYSLMLNNLDFRVFIDRPFFLTLEDRLQRGRDTWALENREWNERLLGIEHSIISPTQEIADVIITQDFGIKRRTESLAERLS